MANKIQIVKLNKTLLFVSEIHGVALGYYTLQFRKRENQNTLSQLRKIWKRARLIEARLEKDSNYLETVYAAKTAVYRHRIDLERPVTSVVAKIADSKALVSLSKAWNMVMNGEGFSVYGKQLKPITCLEKRIKVAKALADKLATIANI